MEADVLREFLVKLGFKVDASSFRQYEGAVSTATATTLKLGAAATAAALAVTVAVTKMSDAMEGMYYASQRIQGSVQNIQAFQYAIGNLGGTASGALSTLENLARFMRNSPGASGLIQNLGVRTADQNGNLRDTVDILKDLGDKLRAMPYYQANAYAGVLGIDEQTLMALRSGTREFASEYASLTRRAGLDSQRAAGDAKDYMNALRGIGAILDVVGRKIYDMISARMLARIRAARDYLTVNFDTIIAVVTRVINGVSEIAAAIVHLFGRAAEVVQALWQWFERLNPDIADLLKILAALGVAWLAFNALITATPVGKVLALSVALLALYDDYKTFAEGGKSLIDWGKWSDEIQFVVDAFDNFAAILKAVRDFMRQLDDISGGLASKLAVVFSPIQGLIDGLREVKNLLPGGGGWSPTTGTSTSSTPPLRRFAELLGVPMGPDPNAPAGAAGPVAPQSRASGSLNTAGMMQFFQSSGWTKAQAAGIVANLMQESGGNPNAVGDGGRARGIAQWHPDRQANFERWSGKKFGDGTAEDQLKFIQYELTQGAERRAGDLLRATTSDRAAGEVVSRQYLRPGATPEARDREATNRGAAAVTINQNTTINAGEANAQDVANLQAAVNQRMVRNTQGAVR